MTEHNLALQLSLLAWQNMKEFLVRPDITDAMLLAICENNIAVLKELKESK